MEHHITTPLTEETIKKLHTGDPVYITGILYSARDAAHKKMTERIDAGEELPFDLNGSLVYYMGPSPATEGQITAQRTDNIFPYG